VAGVQLAALDAKEAPAAQQAPGPPRAVAAARGALRDTGARQQQR
jgi:hypothetical protein